MTGYKWFPITHCLMPCVSETSMLAIKDVSLRTTILADALATILCSFTFFEARTKLTLHCKSTRYVCIRPHTCTSTYMHLFAMLHIKIALCRSGNETLKSSSVKWLTINWSDFSNKVTKQWLIWEHLNIVCFFGH